jgi:hypothetical protein
MSKTEVGGRGGERITLGSSLDSKFAEPVIARAKGLPMAILASMLWRRTDTPGHDACFLERDGDGWKLHGATVFRHEAGPASLAYAVLCSACWETLSGSVRGVFRNHNVDYQITREEGNWSLNGQRIQGLEHLVDLDLNFTPATNYIQLRRISITRNSAVELPVAWFDLDTGTMSELPQIYKRRSETAFWYESPVHGYQAQLELAPNGFIRRYPHLWEAEPAPGMSVTAQSGK